ncbi:DUF6714 family protein [Ralstonia pseudosolanacearum]
MNKELLEKTIVDAFLDVDTPPDWALVRSNEGPEPAKIEKIFRGKHDWKDLKIHELDTEPALSLLSDEAWRYYLQAFIIYDIRGMISHEDVVFHLTNGFSDADREELLNPRRYGTRTRWDSAVFRCSVFSPKQVSAIVAYLNFKLEEEGERGYYAQVIREALANYWLGRT